MNRTSSSTKALYLGVSLLLPASTVDAQQTIVSESSSNWNVYVNDANMTKKWVGFPQNVCLSATNPAGCSVGVTPAPTLYGYAHGGGWVSAPANARWIWAPRACPPGDTTCADITGASSPAASQEFIFETKFYVCDAPLGGTISVAVDDGAEVSVNDTTFTVTSLNALSTLNVPASALYGSSIFSQRENVIRVKARNGDNPPDCDSDQYNCNPAGVVLSASFESAGDLPCKGYLSEADYPTWTQEHLADCPSGQEGEWFHICACGNWLPNMNTCKPRLPKCLASDGTRSISAGTTQAVPCPAGQSGLSRTCQSDGEWGADFGACSCTSGTLCGGRCVDLTTDPMSCGQCGSECPVGAQCAAGVCGCPPGRILCLTERGGTCVDQGAPVDGLTWCGQKSPTVISCGCPAGLECGPIPDSTQLVGTDWYCQKPLPTCTRMTGACTGAHGFGAPRDECTTANGVTQCCHSNVVFGSYPWIVACDDGSVGSKGCTGPCL